MKQTSGYSHHYEESTVINVPAPSIFTFADEHRNFSAHMNQSSVMMGGGKMETRIDQGEGKKLGSHIEMQGKVFGLSLYLDEVITVREPPYRKVWQTVGDVKLIVIDTYQLGFEITPQGNQSILKVFIDYNLPKTIPTHILGILFGKSYAKWCVRQMISTTTEHFK